MGKHLPVETYPCAPATVRGRGVLLGGHAGKDVVLYANGKSIVIRSLVRMRIKIVVCVLVPSVP